MFPEHMGQQKWQLGLHPRFLAVEVWVPPISPPKPWKRLLILSHSKAWFFGHIPEEDGVKMGSKTSWLVQ